MPPAEDPARAAASPVAPTATVEAAAAALAALSPALAARGWPAPEAAARLAGPVLGALVDRLAGGGPRGRVAGALGFPAPPAVVGPAAIDDAAAELARALAADRAGGATPARSTPDVPAGGDPAAAAADIVAVDLGELHADLLGREARWDGDRLALGDPGGRRRAAGAWYTPAELVEALLDRALDPLLDGADAASCPAGGPVVLDPACGSGRFLLAAARRIGAHRGVGATTLLADETLRGWDRDPLAAALARAALWLEAAGTVDPRTAAAAVEVRDALTGTAPAPTADAVVGNPPHGGGLDRRDRRALAERYPPARRAGNTAAAFCVRAHELARPGGRVGLVLPKALTYAHTWAPLRAWLEPAVVDVLDVTTAWPAVRLEQVLLTTRPGGRGGAPVRLGRLGSPPRHVAPARLRQLGTLPTGLDADDERLLGHLEDRTGARLGEVVRTVRGGAAQPWATPAADERHPGAGGRAAGNGAAAPASRHEPVVGGRDLAPLRPATPSRVLDASACPPERVRRAAAPQAAFQNIVAHRTRPADHACLIGTVLTEPLACLDTVNLLVPRTPGVSPWGLAGLLLSDLSSWFVYVACYNRAVRTMHFDNVALARVPLPDPGLPKRLDPLAHAISAAPDDPARWRDLEDAIADAWALPAAARERLAATHAPRAPGTTAAVTPR